MPAHTRSGVTHKLDLGTKVMALAFFALVAVVGIYMERWKHTPLAHPEAKGTVERLGVLESRVETIERERCRCGADD